MHDFVSELVSNNRGGCVVNGQETEKEKSGAISTPSSMKKRKKHAVPMVSFFDFPDAHNFGGLSILGDVSDLELDDPRLIAMEKFAKTALTFLFFSHRDNTKDLTENWNPHQKSKRNTTSSVSI